MNLPGHGAGDPQHRFDEQAIILGCHAAIAGFSRHYRFNTPILVISTNPTLQLSNFQ
jgi:hypothetical protein